MPRTELRLSLIALWVNICLENAEAHRHILFILQNIQRRDLIAILGGHLSLVVSDMIQSKWRRLFVEKKVSRFLVPLHRIHGTVYGA